MSSSSSLKYTQKINSTPSDIHTIDATNYQEICDSIGCYEVISDDKPVKFYYDIDIKEPAEEYTEHLIMFPIVLERAKDTLSRFFKERLNLTVELDFCVCESNSTNFVDWKTKKNYWKLSIHIIINNIIAMKSIQNELIEEVTPTKKKNETIKPLFIFLMKKYKDYYLFHYYANY